jgi:hypothetical protein
VDGNRVTSFRKLPSKTPVQKREYKPHRRILYETPANDCRALHYFQLQKKYVAQFHSKKFGTLASNDYGLHIIVQPIATRKSTSKLHRFSNGWPRYMITSTSQNFLSLRKTLTGSSVSVLLYCTSLLLKDFTVIPCRDVRNISIHYERVYLQITYVILKHTIYM